MKHKIHLYHFSRFIQRFGKIHGTQLFIKLRLNKLNNIKLHNYKNSISLRKGTSDIPTFVQVFLDEEYNDIKYIDNPKIIIDGGANIGLFTVLMKNKFLNAKVISIEPDKENFEVLKKNVSSLNDVYCENCGLWNKETYLKVYDKYEIGKWAMVVEESNNPSDIKAISINTLIDKYSIERIDILKLDIETSEKILFSNGYEDWLPKVKMIIIELHDWLEEDCAKPFFAAINKTFSRYKYETNGYTTIIINKDID